MKIKLWTIRELRCLHELESNGVLTSNGSGCFEDWKEGYKWMINEMTNKIGPSKTKDQYPIWAWFQYNNSKRKKPDLRRSSHLPTGTKGVRIEYEKEASEVLLSDFVLWHTPLCYRCYIGVDESDAIRHDDMLAERGLINLSYSKLPVDVKISVEKSWQRIFDLDFVDEYWTQSTAEKTIQATMWDIKEHEVLKVDYFTAR